MIGTMLGVLFICLLGTVPIAAVSYTHLVRSCDKGYEADYRIQQTSE